MKNILVPSTSDVLYGLIDGSVVSSTWNTLTGKTDQLFSYVLRRTGDSVGGTLGDFLNYLGEGATYVCYSGGKQVAYSTATKYPIIAGGIAIGRSADGKAINRMLQLSPVVIDKLGAASVMSGDKRYETADNMQVYLWSKGQYFATSLPKINTEDYKLIGWYDNFGCSGAGRSVSLWPSRRTEPEIFQSQNSSLAADEAGLLFRSPILPHALFRVTIKTGKIAEKGGAAMIRIALVEDEAEVRGAASGLCAAAHPAVRHRIRGDGVRRRHGAAG